MLLPTHVANSRGPTMPEPPILPPHASAPYSAANNPYSPSHIEPTNSTTGELGKLPLAYWAVLVFLFPIVAALCTYAPGIGIPIAIALVSAVIRVPLIRARARTQSVARLPQPLILLLTSSVFCLLFEIASVCAFCIVCFPLSLMTFSMIGSGNDSPIFVVFGLSGLIALAAYLFLFRLSLRLSI